MQRSDERILTTHVGSLVRPPELVEALRAEQLGQEYNVADFERSLAPAVAEAVRQQVEAGVDIVDDGEYGKVAWTQYVVERLGGIEHRDADPTTMRGGALVSKDRQEFAAYYAVYDRVSSTMWLPPEMASRVGDASFARLGRWFCVAPITYRGRHAIERDIANLKAALAPMQERVTEAFLPLAAPASVEASVPNQHYPSDEAYVYALADALREEYLAVIDAGFLLQVDDAFIPYNYDRLLAQGLSMAEYRKHCQMRIEAVNYALRGIPEDRVRYHICWGSWAGPHTSDVPLKDIVDLVLKVQAQAYSVEAANPRHEYEWKVWREVKLPDGKILIPGVITHSTNVVEHPETIAERIERYAAVVGRENVLAGADCGFAQGWNMARTHPSVQWAKLQALAKGAHLASERLWGTRMARV
jgi:5-methyltetrahydropteroyltriglutamate--homocysteine methyltransferase